MMMIVITIIKIAMMMMMMMMAVMVYCRRWLFYSLKHVRAVSLKEMVDVLSAIFPSTSISNILYN